jgi:hypothetical protein
VADINGRYPLHDAVQFGSDKVVLMLLDAAPHVAGVAIDGILPLSHVIWWYKHLTARAFFRVMDVDAALGVLLSGETHYIAEFVAMRALTEQQWQSVPCPLPGLEKALPAVRARSTREAAEVVRRLSPEQRARLQTTAMCLSRFLPMHLPTRTILPRVALK